MIIHHYDRMTGEYIRSGPARIDERATLVARITIAGADPVWLIPAHATVIAPPPPRAGRAIVFNGAQWLYIRPRHTQPASRGLVDLARSALRSIFRRPRAA